jgi:putative transcriptional regulator
LLPDVAQASWRGALTRGFRFLQVPQLGGPDLFLIHMEAGRSFPCHDHGGLERTLVLVGGLQDAQGVMEAGDFDEAPPGHVHAPVALPDEDCWLLATLEGGIRLRGWRGLLQRVAG